VGILKKLSITECKTTVMDLKKMNDDASDESDPRLIGPLMHLANTRPDSCLVMNVLRQSMSQSRQTHLIIVKHILRYAPSVNLILQDMQIQIEHRVQWTGREHLVVVLP
jgi:hypothetical protein